MLRKQKAGTSPAHKVSSSGIHFPSVQSYYFFSDCQSFRPLKSLRRVKKSSIEKENPDTQIRRIVEAFMERPKTMLEVEYETGIRRDTICRRVAYLWNLGQIQIHHYGNDPITGYPHVQFLTTDPKLFTSPIIVQPSLFD